MGRKIPAKKHRGVKDPLVQQARRLEGLKGKINAPPKDPDEQPVPKSLTRLFAFQDKKMEINVTKKNKFNSQIKIKNNKGGSASAASAASPNPVSRLRKLPGESGREFSLRINSAVKALHNPIEDLHYPGVGAHSIGPKENKCFNRIWAYTEYSIILQASNERQEVVYERVSFGEVTHAPPALHFKAAAGAPRPGRRQLLLNSLLGPGASAAGARAAAGAQTPSDAERARLQAVAAYRALKANKHKMK
ncbi:coiled-coil domain-containing protein 137 [Spodoptera litura]|uniref:Coiled-coil domain-containing protein 137 n=1 Tax=Spodoptera litura TaxID=69820 RepID=A0A9J7EI66_SPOLT|nr:coiled-coil domain-containing protein 137 [Spodoptera litura]